MLETLEVNINILVFFLCLHEREAYVIVAEAEQPMENADTAELHFSR